MKAKTWFVFCAVGVGLSATFLLTFYSRFRRKSKRSRRSADDQNAAEVDLAVGTPKDGTSGDAVLYDQSGLENIDGAQQLTVVQAEMLTSLISGGKLELQQKALITIANKAAFTSNQVIFRKVGCLAKLSSLLRSRDILLRIEGILDSSDLQLGLIAVNNLAMNEENQKQLQSCIPSLINFSTSDRSQEFIRLSSLQVLINLSVTSVYHSQYTPLIQHLFDWIGDDQHTSLCLASLKLLVNLSCNPDMVCHLLNARVTESICNILSPSGTSDDVVIRWLNVLANVLKSVKVKTVEAVLHERKESDELTVYDLLFDLKHSDTLRLNLSRLCSINSESDINLFAVSIIDSLVLLS